MLYVDDPNEPQPIGDCDWCSMPVYEDEDYEYGNGGSGIMHTDCQHDAAYNDAREREDDGGV